MGARTRLNASYINGATIVSGVVAAVFGSWSLFCLLVVVLLATSIYTGDIRLRGRGRK